MATMNRKNRKSLATDAIDVLTGVDETIPVKNQIKEIPIEKIKEFADHPFHLYDGKRLEDMVASIKENGVLTPVIVRKIDNDNYEMLAGHNRMNASELAGLTTIPAYIKEDIDDEDAYTYVIETNLMQRSFADMYPSEQAIVLQTRYDKISKQGKRNDIFEELQALENEHLEKEKEKTVIKDSRGRIAKDYGLSGRSIARLMRINNLIEQWKLAVDNKEIALLTGVEISYIPEELQAKLYSESIEMNVKLSLKDGKILKSKQKEGLLSEDDITKFVLGKCKSSIKKEQTFKKIKLSSKVYEEYFDEGATEEDVEETIKKALKVFFEK